MKVTEEIELAIRAIFSASDCRKPHIQHVGRLLLKEIEKQLPYADAVFRRKVAIDIGRALTATNHKERETISRKMFIATMSAFSQH